jgi:hypothetical protein
MGINAKILRGPFLRFNIRNLTFHQLDIFFKKNEEVISSQHRRNMSSKIKIKTLYKIQKSTKNQREMTTLNLIF